MTNPSDRVALAHTQDPRHPAGGLRELDQRHSDDITVTLLWNARTNRVFVSVLQERDGVSFQFPVAGADAADAFRHPYAYAAHDPQAAALAA